MSRYLKYTFPPGKTDDVCLTQDLASAGSLKLNGNLSNSISSEVPFKNHGYCRSVSITSPDNLIDVEFTIIGVQNGVLISDVILGPVSETIYLTEIFDVITSITVDGGVTNVSVGSGTDGFINIIGTNNNIDPEYGLTIINPETTRTTTMYDFLEDIPNNGHTYLENIQANNLFSDPFPELSTSTDSPRQYFSDVMSRYLLVHIQGDNTTIDHTTVIRFAQSGDYE